VCLHLTSKMLLSPFHINVLGAVLHCVPICCVLCCVLLCAVLCCGTGTCVAVVCWAPLCTCTWQLTPATSGTGCVCVRGGGATVGALSAFLLCCALMSGAWSGHKLGTL
jgi:hypothetical protein